MQRNAPYLLSRIYYYSYSAAILLTICECNKAVDLRNAKDFKPGEMATVVVEYHCC